MADVRSQISYNNPKSSLWNDHNLICERLQSFRWAFWFPSLADMFPSFPLFLCSSGALIPFFPPDGVLGVWAQVAYTLHSHVSGVNLLTSLSERKQTCLSLNMLSYKYEPCAGCEIFCENRQTCTNYFSVYTACSVASNAVRIQGCWVCIWQRISPVN